MWRSTSYTVKANDLNVKVKDFKCGGQRLILLRLMTLMFKCGGQCLILLRLMTLMLRSRTLSVEVKVLYC